MTTPNGLLLIDKASGPTSHDVVARVRRALGVRRVGHAGTLDPMATGLLLVAVGPATRLLRFAQVTTKRYSGEVTLGVATDSLDADGALVASAPVPALDEAALAAAAAAFTGSILQRAPMVSARRVGGERLHALARRGVEVERPAREVLIHAFALDPTEDPARWRFTVTCSTGTYVRVLLAELAERLGTVGHLSALRREASGARRVEEARTVELFEADVAAGDPGLEPPSALVASLERFAVDAADARRLRQGQRVPGPPLEGEVAVFDEAGELVAVAERVDGLYRPVVVLATGAPGRDG
ncbi:MAG TPA: tRNA pseudouridine(55) synthase TruB [Acidimicrobiales bacterium]|nr:MAG: tRNA pseudouridine(55) synthase TruB [Actinobacteria bacterium 21-73-9]HQU27295.1 tRNA pseudouridine(55) synthase TruB [Acidimicrobiales bacterium]